MLSPASSDSGEQGDSLQVLRQLADAALSLPCLRVRIRFLREHDGAPLRQEARVWRAALKQGLDRALSPILFPEPNPDRQKMPPPPGLLLQATPDPVLTFFGGAMDHAQAAVGALVAAAAGWIPHLGGGASGLGQQRVIGVLSGLDVWALPQGWQPTAMPVSPTSWQHAARAVEDLLGSGLARSGPAFEVDDRPVPEVAVQLLSAAILPHEQAPGLTELTRALWPRVFDTVAAWHPPAVLPPREAVRRALESLPPWPPLQGSTWCDVRLQDGSGRQGRRWVQVGHRGWLGYRNMPPAVLQLLRAGQVFGLGQGATHGMGRYRVWISPDAT